MYRTTGIWLLYSLVLLNLFLVSSKGNHTLLDEEDEETSTEKSLIQMLLNRYKQYGVVGRPVNDSRVKIVIQYGLQLIQLLGLDENKQVLRTNCWAMYRWNDALLRWNSTEYGGIAALRIFPRQIWTPDIKLYNFADERLEEFRDGRLVVYNDGSILWLKQALFKSSCQVEITYFPFDSQVCMLEFGSMTYDESQLDLEWWIPDGSETPMPYVDFSDYVPANEWFTDGEFERDVPHEQRVHQLRSVKRYRVREKVIGKQKFERHYTVLRYLIKLYRNPSFHLFILVLPCLLLSLLALVAFWLPPDSAAKMMLGINIFVAFFVLLILLAKSMPSSIKNFPFIGIFFCLNMVLVTLSIFLATLVVNLFYRGNQGAPPPKWVCRYIIDGLGRIMGLRQNIPLVRTSPQSTANDVTQESQLDGEQTLPAQFEPSIKSHVEPSSVNLKSRDSMISQRVTLETQQISRDLMTLSIRQTKASQKQMIAIEWRTLALIVDRVFFMIYLIALIGTTIVVMMKTEVIDMTHNLINKNVARLGQE